MGVWRKNDKNSTVPDNTKYLLMKLMGLSIATKILLMRQRHALSKNKPWSEERVLEMVAARMEEFIILLSWTVIVSKKSLPSRT